MLVSYANCQNRGDDLSQTVKVAKAALAAGIYGRGSSKLSTVFLSSLTR